MKRSEFDVKVDVLLSKAEHTISCEVPPDLPYTKNAPGIPVWHNFEFTIWNIAEEIRQLSLASKKTFNKSQLDRIVGICLNPNAKRGRQSFVMLLGKTKYCDYSSSLITLLDDEDVNGHVIDTLYKMRATGYAALIAPFMDHRQTWIRNVAKKYVQKFESSDFSI